jgi:Family of unknown function (DUF5906)
MGGFSELDIHNQNARSGYQSTGESKGGLSLESLQSVLGGEIQQGDKGWYLRTRGPGHSIHDNSLVVWLNPNSEYGFGFTSYASDSREDCIEHILSCIEDEPDLALKKIVKTYDYTDEDSKLLFQVVRFEPKGFSQRRPDGDGYKYSIYGVRRVLYRLPAILEAVKARELILICEGEKDADNLVSLGFQATTVPAGAVTTQKRTWLKDYTATLKGADVVIIPDLDKAGSEHAQQVVDKTYGVVKRVRVLSLPGLDDVEKGDISDWLAKGGTADELRQLIDAAPEGKPTGYCLDDFSAYLPSHNFIFHPLGELWPEASVNDLLPWIDTGEVKEKKVRGVVTEVPVMMAPSRWLLKNRNVEQMTWVPGEDRIIKDRLFNEGGWIAKNGARAFNLYLPPTLPLGDPTQAGKWIDHVRLLYPDEADHIIRWLAHRVQRPGDKINHALVLGGEQGVGKDTILEPLKPGVGPWNFHEVTPSVLLGRFNGYLQSVILRVNEARDLGDVNRYALYDHMKILTAAPPDALRVDEKNIREHHVPNLCGVIFTTNYKTDGIYLPADDRRHFVAWCEKSKSEFTEDYFIDLYGWFQNEGGFGHVAAYLAGLDLTGFDPKAPPKKTDAFWAIVDSGRAPEEAELDSVIDLIGKPDAFILSMLTDKKTITLSAPCTNG